MDHSELDEALFFDAVPGAYAIYHAFKDAVLKAYPDAKLRVQKTQITYYHKHVYACVSFARVRRKTELPEKWLTLTLGLPYALDSARVAVKTEAYPGRWTTHFVIGSPEELDEELFSWIEQAYVFSERK